MVISDVGDEVVPVFVVKLCWGGQDSPEQVGHVSVLLSGSLLLYHSLPEDVAPVLEAGCGQGLLTLIPKQGGEVLVCDSLYDSLVTA